MPLKPVLRTLALFTPAAAFAGPLPLVTGPYVLAGTPCADAPFAAMRSYDGHGLGDPHSHDCRTRVMSRVHARYVVENDCIGVGTGPGPRTTERLSLRLGPANRTGYSTAFSILSPGGTPLAYRVCPIPVT